MAEALWELKTGFASRGADLLHLPGHLKGSEVVSSELRVSLSSSTTALAGSSLLRSSTREESDLVQEEDIRLK